MHLEEAADALNNRNVSIIDSGTTHTIFRCKEFFSHLTMTKAKVHTFTGSGDLIDGHGTAQVSLPNGTILTFITLCTLQSRIGI